MDADAAMPALSGDSVHATMTVGGRERTYTAYAPAGLEPGAPLLMVFHGSFEDGDTIRRNTGYEFDALADRHRFAVAYPDGYQNGWNDCRRMASTPARRENVDDVGFVQALAGSLHARYGIDDRRIYAAGYSNGGQMVFRLAAEMPERLAAIAAIAANLPGGDDNACAPMGTPLPVLTMAGTADPISPYAGGEVTIFGFSPRGEVLSADDTAQTFVRLNGLASATDRRTLPHQPRSGDTEVIATTYASTGKPPVVQYTIVGGGHVVPTAEHRYRRLVGPSTHDVDAPQVIWDFFTGRAA